MKDRFKFRTYIPDLKFFKYWGWVEECHYVNMCACGDYSMPELLKNYTDQCTGLKDKNGKLIYEGDIVKQGDAKYVVNWSEGTFCFKGLKTLHNFTIEYVMPSKQEVIGNIYENKGLLNENQEKKSIQTM